MDKTLGFDNYILGAKTIILGELRRIYKLHNTGELGYDGLNGKIGPSYAKSVVYI